jgi:hypothetical protein
MQVSEGVTVIEPIGLGHEVLDQGQHSIGVVDKRAQRPAPVCLFVRLALIEPGLRPCGIIGRRQPDESEIIPALEVGAFLFELRAALRIDEAGRRIRKAAVWIVVCRQTLRFDKDCPAGTQPSQGIVEPGCNGHEFSGRGGVQIGSAKAGGTLQRTVLIEDDALLDQGCPRQKVGKALGATTIFGEIHHRAPHAARCCG